LKPPSQGQCPDNPFASPRRRPATPHLQRRRQLARLSAYEQACQTGGGGAYLRREGLHSSLISEWRKQRDAGILDGTKPSPEIGKLTAEQAEIARLTRELERANKKLDTTQTALGIMGKAHELLEQLSESTNTDELRKKR
jgi:transposase-like protein